MKACLHRTDSMQTCITASLRRVRKEPGIEMDKKVLVLDLDGTLTNSEKKITPETKAALMEMQEKGHTVVLASGRPTAGITPLAKELKLKEHGGYILSFNGGKITDCSSDEVIYQKTLPPELVPELFSLARKLDIGLLSYDEDNNIITGMHYDEYIDVEKNINHLPVKQMEKVEDYVDFPLNKCLGTAEPEMAAEAEKIYAKKFGDKLCISRSEPFFVEITPKGIDKAASLERFCKMTGNKRKDMIACGDGFNDLSMIKYAGLGVAMENAQPVVKDAADYVTASNDEDGVAKVIHKFILQDDVSGNADIM